MFTCLAWVGDCRWRISLRSDHFKTSRDLWFREPRAGTTPVPSPRERKLCARAASRNRSINYGKTSSNENWVLPMSKKIKPQMISVCIPKCIMPHEYQMVNQPWKALIVAWHEKNDAPVSDSEPKIPSRPQLGMWDKDAANPLVSAGELDS